MTTKYLLDTCAVLWIANRTHMSSSTLAALRNAHESGQPARVSLITAWELGLLSSHNRLPSTQEPRELFDEFIAQPGIALQVLTVEILIQASFLPGPIHRDPADRIIVATARALDMTLVTDDRLILDYANKGYVRALPC